MPLLIAAAFISSFVLHACEFSQDSLLTLLLQWIHHDMTMSNEHMLSRLLRLLEI